jgi:hypothetical protein
VVLAALVMGAEQVGAEVVPRVVPHGMDVVGAVLAVVVLDQERRPVQPLVVRLLRIDGPGPREVNALAPCLAHPPQLLLGDLAPHVARVGLDETERQAARLGRERAEGDAGRRLQAIAATRSAHDVAKRLGGDDETAAQARVDTPGDGDTEILLLGKRNLARKR